ncbi:MAG: hypothetical protein LBO08_03345 [Rickettsiales bacterium]|jgi:hypothetical protein|nr:hypothetical protein [Rickettsiales bacterium]
MQTNKVLKIFARKLQFATVCISLAGAAFAHDCINDAIRGKKLGCDDSCADSGWKVGEGKRAFCEFPQLRTCRDGGFMQNDYWRGCGDLFCSGFSREKYSTETMEPEPRGNDSGTLAVTNTSSVSSACWAYKCRNGFVWHQGNCITPAACRAIEGMDTALDANGNATACIASKWCIDSDKQTYNSKIHDVVQISGCQKYNCKPGRCFVSDENKTCTDIEDGVFGGKVANAESGVCEPCPDNKYASPTGCIAGMTASMLQLKDCYNCTSTEDFAECVKTKSNVKCNSAD